jgi:hypothetical protein
MTECLDGREFQSIDSLCPIGWLWQAGQPADHMVITWAASLHSRYRDEFEEVRIRDSISLSRHLRPVSPKGILK